MTATKTFHLFLFAVFAVTPLPLAAADANGPAAGNPTTNLRPSAAGSNTFVTMDTLEDKHKLTLGDKLSFRIVEDQEDPKELMDPKPLVVTDHGDVEVPYIGRFPAVGKTCRQLGREIKVELEKKYYYQATVMIGLDQFTKTTGKVYVLGEVRLTGLIEMPGDETITAGKAVLRAGGFTNYADKRNVKVTHKSDPAAPGAKPQTFVVNRWLAQYGHQVTVVTGFPNYPSGEFPESYRGRLRAREKMDGMDVLRTWVYASSHRSNLRRLANYFSFVACGTLAGLTCGRSFDVVLASSPPLFVGLAGWLVASLRRIPWVFDIRDLWPEVAVEAGEFASDGTLTRLGKWLADFLYRRATHLTPVTHNKLQKLLLAGVPATKMLVVTNGVDLDRWESNGDPQKRRELGLEQKFVVLYAGLIGIAQGVEVVIDAANRLRSHEDIHFLIVGDGVRRDAVVKRAEQLGLSNVTLLPRQPREQIPGLMAAADACLVPLASSKLDDAVPSKLLEAWAYEKPVILAAAGEAAELVHESGGGIAVPPEEPGRLADAVLALKSDGLRRAECARRGNELVRQRFDRRELARQMEKVLLGVVNDRQKRSPKPSVVKLS